MKRPSVPDPVQRGDVRQRIVCAALQLLRSQGFSALTQAGVATAAGLRQSHLTYYFPTRTDLLKGVVEQGARSMLEAMTREGGGSPLTLTRIREVVLAASRDSGLPRLMIALIVASDEEPSLKRWLYEFDRDLKRHLALSLRAVGLDPSPAEMALLHATLVGAAVLRLQAPGDEGLKQSLRIVRQALDRLIAGCRMRA